MLQTLGPVPQLVEPRLELLHASEGLRGAGFGLLELEPQPLRLALVILELLARRLELGLEPPALGQALLAFLLLSLLLLARSRPLILGLLLLGWRDPGFGALEAGRLAVGVERARCIRLEAA